MPITGIGSAADVDPVASLVTALNAATAATTAAGTAATSATSALNSRQVIAGTGLTGGGTLAADRTFTVDFASSGVSSTTKAVRADDSRLFDTLNVAGDRVVALGDSMTSNYGNSTRPDNALGAVQLADSYLSTALVKAKAAPRWDGIYGAGGYTLENMRDLLLPLILAKSPLPHACVLLGGRNNVAANGGSGFVASAAIAVVNTMYTSLQAVGVRLIVCTIPPAADNATVNQNVDKYNRALRTWASLNSVDLVDFHRVLVDQVTAGYRTGYGQTDGIHPSYLGTRVMADELLPVLTTRCAPSKPPLAEHALDATNLITSGRGLFGSDGNSDGIADGWASFSGSNYTFSIVTDADGVTKWQRITVGTTSTGQGLLQWSANSLCSPGDLIELCARVQTSSFEANLVAPVSAGSGGTGPSWSMSASFTSATGATGISPALTMHTDIIDGVLYARGLVGASASGQIKVNLQTGGAPATGTCYVQFANVALRNLTTLGLTV